MQDDRSAPLLWLETFFRDTIYAIRGLRGQPGFAAAAIVTLALAIGLNTSLFTVFNAVALRPWPVSDAGRVVSVYSVETTGEAGGFTYDEYRYFAGHARSFSGLVAGRQIYASLENESPEKARLCHLVSGNYFRALGVEMRLGRGFLPEEDRPGSPTAIAVLSHALWQNRFGGDAAVLGRSVRINGVPFTVVGVAPREFTGAGAMPFDVWLPLAAFDAIRGDTGANTYYTVSIAGRLAPGISRDRARAELAVLRQSYRAGSNVKPAGIVLTGTAGFEDPNTRKEFVPVFGAMFLAVLLVLLLACANVGNLLVARAAARRREIAVRLSLGAGRLRVVRQLVTESLVLSIAAGAIGAWLACWAPTRLIAALAPGEQFPRLTPDLTVLAFSLSLSVFACFAFGLAPALHGTRLSLFETLKNQRPPARSGISLRSFLLAAQVAISVVLLISAGLLVRGIQNARAVDPGFAVKDVAAASIVLPADSYSTARARTLASQILSELESSPNAGPAALSTLEPLGAGKRATSFTISDEPPRANMVLYQEISPRYFDVLRIPVVAGRVFDRTGNFAMVNETMAKRFWPDRSPIGRSIRVGRETYEITGIAKDARVYDLDRVEPALYLPISGQVTPRILMRTEGTGALRRLEAMVARAEPRATVHTNFLSTNVEKWLRPSRLGSALAGALGVLALTLASVGMFGVFAYSVRQRTREIGTRMALGAPRGRIVLDVLLGSSRAVAGGLGAGFAGGLIASSLIESGLHGIARLDPAAYAAVLALTAVAALAASLWPARMISKVDPITALRCE